jgi:hypothetical protein
MHHPLWVAGFGVSNRVHPMDCSHMPDLWAKEGQTRPDHVSASPATLLSAPVQMDLALHVSLQGETQRQGEEQFNPTQCASKLLNME